MGSRYLLCMASSARLAGDRENIWGPECLVSASTGSSLPGERSAGLAFFCLILLFSRNDFPTFKMCLSFREGAEATLWGGHYHTAP